MRKANTNDLFNIARLVNELGLRDDFFKAQNGTDDVEKIGYDLVFSILSKATTEKAQESIYQVLCSPFEMTKE